tara:strand:- start:189 stop:296 length:108 start_codon:yes stop_codon:yes gene_type:complete
MGYLFVIIVNLFAENELLEFNSSISSVIIKKENIK